MCPYAASVMGTATKFVTANNAVMKLDIISQVSYPTKKRARVVNTWSSVTMNS